MVPGFTSLKLKEPLSIIAFNVSLPDMAIALLNELAGVRVPLIDPVLTAVNANNPIAATTVNAAIFNLVDFIKSEI